MPCIFPGILGRKVCILPTLSSYLKSLDPTPWGPGAGKASTESHAINSHLGPHCGTLLLTLCGYFDLNMNPSARELQ
jgi:hypothetical protein